MAKSTNTKCPRCGEKQFLVIPKSDTGFEKDVLVCDSCGSKFWKPKDFRDENGVGY